MKKNIIILLTGFLFIYILLYSLLYPKSGMVKEFYKQDKNTVDVLILGSSNSYSNINPAILWEDYGISSYLFCGSGQPIWNSYYYLKEAYKTQSPKVVVLDVFTTAAYQEGYDELSNVPGNTLSLNWSLNKLESMRCSADGDDFVHLLLGLPIFHNRWTECFIGTEKPWEYDTRFHAIEKGFYPVFFYEDFEQQLVNTEVYQDLSEKNREYLQAIIELTKEQGSELLLIKTPYVLGSDYDAVYNCVSEIAKANDVNFINMNLQSDAMGFNFSNDMADTVHLNNLGSEKVTKYLGGVLSENYAVENHKGDLRYDSWQEYSDNYSKTLFMCPSIKREQLVEEFDADLQMQSVSDTLNILSLPVTLKKNKYYKINIQMQGDTIDEAIVDIFGENYDFIGQKRKLFVKDGDNFVIISTDDQLPDTSYIRLYSSQMIEGIERVLVYELEVE